MGALARELGFQQISLSSEVMPMVRMVPRGYTACIDTYLTPCILRYLQSFRDGFASQLQVRRRGLGGGGHWLVWASGIAACPGVPGSTRSSAVVLCNPDCCVKAEVGLFLHVTQAQRLSFVN